MRTTAEGHGPWAPWPPTSGPACPRWRPPSPPSQENLTRWPSRTPAQAPPANTGIDLARLAARTACAGPHHHPDLRPPWCYRHDPLVTGRNRRLPLLAVLAAGVIAGLVGVTCGERRTMPAL